MRFRASRIIGRGFGLFGFDLPVDSFYQSRGREFEWAYLGGNAQSHGIPIISFGPTRS